MTVDGVAQIIADSFDGNMSRPNGKSSTHLLVMIEWFPESNATTESQRKR